MVRIGGVSGFVGRRRELTRLVAALQAAPSVVLVEGEAGAGKSALVRQALAESGAAPERVLTGYCHPLAEPTPYGPVLDALRCSGPLLAGASELPPSAGALRSWLPDLGAWLPEPVEGGDERYRLVQGVRALFYSADVAFEAIESENAPENAASKARAKRRDNLLITVATIIGVLIPVALFFLLPTLLAGLMDNLIGSGILRNLCEGLIRIILFVIFMFSVSRMKDIQRTFAYHGAEHKSIHCYERRQELTLERVRDCAKEHPRCGTSFLLVVMVVSILVFSVVQWSHPLIRLALRLALLPVVVAISYELNRAVGRHDNALTRFLRAPGLWMQRLTTVEPDDAMLEVAIAALREVIPEEGLDRW